MLFRKVWVEKQAYAKQSAKQLPVKTRSDG